MKKVCGGIIVALISVQAFAGSSIFCITEDKSVVIKATDSIIHYTALTGSIKEGFSRGGSSVYERITLVEKGFETLEIKSILFNFKGQFSFDDKGYKGIIDSHSPDLENKTMTCYHMVVE